MHIVYDVALLVMLCIDRLDVLVLSVDGVRRGAILGCALDFPQPLAQDIFARVIQSISGIGCGVHGRISFSIIHILCS